MEALTSAWKVRMRAVGWKQKTLRFHFMCNDVIDIEMEAKRVDDLVWRLEKIYTTIYFIREFRVQKKYL